MKNIKKLLVVPFAAAMLFTACKPDDNIVTPEPEQQEVITTLSLHVTNNSGFDKTFSYKVDNGFNGTGATTPVIDDIELSANTTYSVEAMLYNESENPKEDVTVEVKEENTEHLFLYQSTPATGAGSISFANGSLDNNGAPFNQMIDFTTGNTGNGSLVVTLKHQPNDKSASTPDAAGGETDAQATFPVIIQ